uniref:winged helix-turn-helix domain-containing protein n=1 Tax=Serratia proteamaculans TaxID=28151 RepID=UPI001F4C3ABF|nr:winged helix-turn-helix domain-containing protein [Serratia proteamaculans]
MSRELISTNVPGKKVILGVAAAYCLETLLDAKGDIVSQDTLINEGWRKHGYEVSPGNVRQVVSQLRRGFTSLKESSDLLITVTKKGYRIEPYILSNDVTITVPPLTIQASSTEDAPTIHSNNLKTKSKRSYLTYTVLTINLMLASLLYYYTSTTSLQKTFYEKSKIKITKKTNLYINKKIADETEYINKGINILKTSPLWTEGQDDLMWVYMNGAKDKKIFSFFICDNDIKFKNSSCASRIFIEK